MTEDVLGVALEVAFALLLAAPPVAGVISAVRALRRRTTGWARAAPRRQRAARGALPVCGRDSLVVLRASGLSN